MEELGEQDSSLHFRPDLESLRPFSLTGTQAFTITKGVTTRNAPKLSSTPRPPAMKAPERAETGKFHCSVWTDGSDCWRLPVPLPCSLRSVEPSEIMFQALGVAQGSVRSSAAAGAGWHLPFMDQMRWGEVWGQAFPRWGGPLLIGTHNIWCVPSSFSPQSTVFSTACVWDVLKAHRDRGYRQVGICLPF